VERGSNKKGPLADEQMSSEEEALQRSTKEGHIEEEREKEIDSPEEGLEGSGSSAPEHTYEDWGEIGGKSHPKPKDSDS